jgi:hypothetical protein
VKNSRLGNHYIANSVHNHRPGERAWERANDNASFKHGDDDHNDGRYRHRDDRDRHRDRDRDRDNSGAGNNRGSGGSG